MQQSTCRLHYVLLEGRLSLSFSLYFLFFYVYVSCVFLLECVYALIPDGLCGVISVAADDVGIRCFVRSVVLVVVVSLVPLPVISYLLFTCLCCCCLPFVLGINTHCLYVRVICTTVRVAISITRGVEKCELSSW